MGKARSSEAAPAKPRTKADTKSNKGAGRKQAMQARSGVERVGREKPVRDTAYPIGKGRKALKGIAIYMHPLAKDVLDEIARDTGKTVQELGLEALNLLFLHYEQKPIA